ncbi:unnamed protein product [Effrenium voratum]|uniref:Uncharacterized protein n=1 Tax=Effrenium voratum TaxID=2562239 RepID=A0AA36HV27_9DINO|nr:unnamed protein product [Effrenium voratum]CAJ1417795.1 unnamed protein product [Effrenium voratum]
MGNVDLDSEDEPVPAVAHVAPEKDMALDGSHGLHAVSELRVEMAEETQMALLVVEPEDTIAQEPMEIDYDDEVLQIGELNDPWIDPDYASQDARMEKAFGISDGLRPGLASDCHR